jgi:hypothetical protein
MFEPPRHEGQEMTVTYESVSTKERWIVDTKRYGALPSLAANAT